MKTNNAQNNKGVGVNSIKIILISAIILAVSFLCFVIFLKIFNKNNEVVEGALYTFNSNLDASNNSNLDMLETYDSFQITNAEGFKFYMDAMVKRGEKIFSGKPTYISNDIDLAGYTFGHYLFYLYGTLDGQNHILKNVHTEVYGLFRYIKGSLVNVYFYNPILVLGQNSSQPGIITDCLNNGARIENCIISNPTIQNTVYGLFSTNTSVAAMVGTNNGIIINCLIFGDYNAIGAQGSTLGITVNHNVFAYAFSVTDKFSSNNSGYGGSLNYSIYSARLTLKGADDMQDCIAEQKNGNCNYYYDNFSDAVDNMSSDVLSTDVGTDGTPWFYIPNEYDPMLRSFITWKDVKVKINDDYIVMGNIKINGTEKTEGKIQIPQDYTISTTFPNTAEHLTIAGNEIIATPSDNAEFVNWTKNDDTIIANFKYKPVEVLIIVVDENKQASSNATYNVNCTLGGNEYTPNNNKYTQGVIIELSNIIVTNSSYYLKRVYYQLSGSNDEIEISSSNGKYVYEVSNVATIYIEVKLKSYGLVTN